jgi:integrase
LQTKSDVGAVRVFRARAVRRGSNRLAPMYQGVVTLAYYTGWRVNSEILTLAWREIDREACVIRLEPGTTKNREGRLFIYAGLDELVAVIEGLWARHQVLERDGTVTPLVFCRRQGQAVKTFRKRWKTACEAGGCPGRTPHDFRRTAVRNLNRHSGDGRDEDHRPQDAQRVRSLRHHERRGSRGGDAEAASVDDGDNFGDKRDRGRRRASGSDR